MKAELIKEEVVPVFKPMTVQVTITTQEEYDAMQVAGRSLIISEIQATDDGYDMYSVQTRSLWIQVLNGIAEAIR